MPALTWSPKAILRTLGGGLEKMKQSSLTEDGTSGWISGRGSGSGLRHIVGEGLVREESLEVRAGHRTRLTPAVL